MPQTSARGGASSTRGASGAIIDDGRELGVLQRISSRSIGIEDKDDIIADLKQALAQVGD